MTLQIRQVQEGDEECVVRFYYESARTMTPPEYWRWKYFENPAGRAGVFVALDGERIVGRFGFIPIRVRIKGKEVLAAVPVDGDVLEGYRKGGLFFDLAQSATQASVEKGVFFDFGFGPPSRVRIVVRTLGFGLVAPVRRVVKIVVPLIPKLAGKGLTGIVGLIRKTADRSIQVKEIPYFDPRFDQLWAKWSGADIAVVRDSAYLNWRYINCPVADYKVFAAERSGELSGFVVLESFHRGWLRCGNIVDFLASHDDEITAALLSAAIHHFAKQRTVIVIAWVPYHSPLSSSFREMGFRSFPSWVNLCARSCQDQEMPQAYLEDERHWHYAIGDKDYFPGIRRVNWK